MVWDKLPSWVRRSMKTSLYFVLALLGLTLILSFWNMFTSSFSCHIGGLVGFSGGSYSLGNCFFPMIIFIFVAIPVAIIGAVVGIIIDMIFFFIRKSKKD